MDQPLPTSSASLADAFNGVTGRPRRNEGLSFTSFLASLATGLTLFGIQFTLFSVLKSRFPRIYAPKTYLVPIRERVEAPPPGIIGWLKPILKTSNSEFIHKCGLDAYLFLRYLRLLLKIFVPAALVVLPVLLPLNSVGPNNGTSGMDIFGWQNVGPAKSNRLWAHLILAVVLVVYVCFLFFDELRKFIRLRQAYLTSPQHRMRASATTVLVTSIPGNWLSYEALDGLFDVYPGGVRNIWVNRNFDGLMEKIRLRDWYARRLEAAETQLIRTAQKMQLKTSEQQQKKAGKKRTRAEKKADATARDRQAERTANVPGLSSGDPHQTPHTIDDVLGDDGVPSSLDSSVGEGKRSVIPIPVLEKTIEAVGQRLEMAGQGVAQLGQNAVEGVFDGLKRVVRDVGETLAAAETGAGVDVDSAGPLHDSKGAALPSDTVVGTAVGYGKHVKEVDGTLPTDINSELPNPDDMTLDEDDEGALWRKYLNPAKRETMRLPLFQKLSWWPSIPLMGKKVDVIYWCRKELAKLNQEIEADQANPERFPLMNSAFIQFNHQVAAHMACQSLTHHVPKLMAPRWVEISPDDVLWHNLSMKWWERYLRTSVVILCIIGLTLLWAFPVTFTGLLSQVSYLRSVSWLRWISTLPTVVLSIVQGALPPALLALLLILLPMVFRFLADQQGVPTGVARELSVQNYFFVFLFLQVFLLVSISAGITSTIQELVNNPLSVPRTLASNLPRASNYFFSYMILQALSVSSGALMQVASLFGVFILGPLTDSTARQKFNRNVRLQSVQWGAFFPIYTNLAAIGLIYSIISPLILIFNVITFSLFWLAYRYVSLYVNQVRIDTGGLLFPKAINQLFTGLYVMELCLVGLFFLVETSNAHAIVMIIVLCFTFLYQVLLNQAFGPLFKYIPISLEDDAVRRDEEFARAQSKRWKLVRGEQEGDDIHELLKNREENELKHCRETTGIELTGVGKGHGAPDETHDRLEPGAPSLGAAQKTSPVSWAQRPARRATDASQPILDAVSSVTRRHHRLKKEQEPRTFSVTQDLESQRAVGDILFSGISDVIEDLDPEERDRLVRRAFQHAALRARRPVVWIPRDELGISDDEVRRTQRFNEKYIWISNDYTSLDAKCRVLIKRAPPDFSEVDLIQL